MREIKHHVHARTSIIENSWVFRGTHVSPAESHLYIALLEREIILKVLQLELYTIYMTLSCIILFPYTKFHVISYYSKGEITIICIFVKGK